MLFLCDCVPVKSHPDICCVFYSSLPLIRPLFLQLVLRTQTGRKERTAKKLVMTKASQNVRVGSDRSGMSSYKSGIIVKFLTMFRRLSIVMTFSDIYFLSFTHVPYRGLTALSFLILYEPTPNDLNYMEESNIIIKIMDNYA